MNARALVFGGSMLVASGTTRWAPAVEPEPEPATASTDLRGERQRLADDEDVSDAWMLSVEGVTHAPVDAGFQIGIELPFRVRAFGGYGWVPSAYRDLIVGAATRGANDGARAVIENGLDGGRSWRVQAGLRPFANAGVYLDVGYSQLRLDGTLDGEDLAEAAGVPPGSAAGVSYAVESTLHMWLVELGYQWTLFDHVVTAIAAGLMGTLDANTEATPGAPVGGAEERALRSEATSIVDQQIESYGVVPTLTLRLGLDLF